MFGQSKRKALSAEAFSGINKGSFEKSKCLVTLLFIIAL